MLNYTDITQNTYFQSSVVTEILAREVCNFDSYYSLIDYQIHILYSLVCYITQSPLIVNYRRFGTIYRFRLKGSSSSRRTQDILFRRLNT